MTLTEQNVQHFWAGEYQYRRRSVLAVGIVCAGLGLFFLAWCVTSFWARPNWGPVIGLVLPMPILWLAYFTLISYARSKRIQYEIDSNGIRVGNKTWGWNQVIWIAAHRGQRTGTYEIFFQTRGWLSPDGRLMTNEGISDDEYETIEARLTAFLGKHHPHVRVG